mgnify:CR=1 FL=1
MQVKKYLGELIIRQTAEFSIHQAMVSGMPRGEFSFFATPSRDGKRIWYHPAPRTPGGAEEVYARSTNDALRSEGFGGRMISFPMADGSTIQVQGPWKGGANQLFADTGVDLRATYYTRGVVALYRSCKFKNGNYAAPDLYCDVLHFDEEPVLGTFDRVEVIAQTFADEYNTPVHVATISRGGGYAGMKSPQKKETL